MMKKTLLLSFAFLALFNACSKDDDKKENFDGSTEAIRNFVTPDLMDTMTDLGMALNSGDTPPEISGSYFIEPVLEATNRPTDIVGQFYEDYDLKFENQQNSALTIDFSYAGATEEGESTKSFIAGSGNMFSAFLKSESVTDGKKAESIMVISGEISEDGIIDYQMAVFMLDNNGNVPTFIENGEGRIFKDSDDIGIRTIAIERRMDSSQKGSLSVK